MNFKIKNNGKNGSIDITPTGLTYTDKQWLGRPDTSFISFDRVNSVTHCSRFIRADAVRLDVGGAVFTWKCKQASKLTDMINRGRCGDIFSAGVADTVKSTGNNYGPLNLLVDAGLTMLTGGIWLIYVFVREMRK